VTHLPIEDFERLNWLACLITFALIVWRVGPRRFLLVKPSTLMVIFHHLFIQWGATINASTTAELLPDPLAFAVLVHGFPLCGLLLTSWTGQRTARLTWARLRHPRPSKGSLRHRALVILGLYGVAVLAVYLSMVPLRSTGLFTIFADPSYSALAREQSLKLLESAALRYSYLLYVSAIAPVLAVLLTQVAAAAIQKRRGFSAAAAGVALVLTIVAASLSGARGNVVFLGAAVAYAYLLRRGLRINPLYPILITLLLLAAPAAQTMLREDREFTLSTFLTYFGNFVGYRVLIVPYTTGLWFCHYAQTTGFFGVAGIPKLALLMDVQPLNVPNLVALSYGGGGLASASANTGYLFAFYSYFGMVSFPFSLAGLWLLDLALPVYRAVADELLAATVAAASISSVGFTFSDYTTAWLSGGFGVILATAWLLSRGRPLGPVHTAVVARRSAASFSPASLGRREVLR
jgi:hypothetical protein